MTTINPELDKRLTRIEKMLMWIIDWKTSNSDTPDKRLEDFNPPKTQHPDLRDEKKSIEAEAKKKHIKKHSKLPPKEKAERIAELTEKAFQEKEVN